MTTIKNMQNILDNADLIFTPDQINQSLDKVAAAMTADLKDENPILLGIMNGGLVPLAKLAERLHFPLRLDYLHATRYREREYGEDLEWKKENAIPMEGETVVIVDDILDEGYTLEAIVHFCKKQKAKTIKTMVMVTKDHDRGADITVDYSGLIVPDRYVFGFGMDYRGYWRNAPGIFALAEEKA